MPQPLERLHTQGVTALPCKIAVAHHLTPSFSTGLNNRGSDYGFNATSTCQYECLYLVYFPSLGKLL